MKEGAADPELKRAAKQRRAGSSVPTGLPKWPNDSLGDRLYSDEQVSRVRTVPPIRIARIPDPKKLASDPNQWETATLVLARAVMIDGLGVQDPAVSAMLDALAPIAEAELTATMEAAREAISDGLPPGAISPEGFSGDGPVYILGCNILLHVVWSLIGLDPLPETLERIVPVVEDAVPGRGRPVAEALLRAYGDTYLCEQRVDLDLLHSLGDDTSGEPLADLVRTGVIALEEALRVGLEVLRHLAELCSSEAISILEHPTPAPG